MTNEETATEASEFDETKQELLRAISNDFIENKENVLEFLDDLKKLHFKNGYPEIREQIRDFSEIQPGMFRAITYSLVGTEQFFVDIKEFVSEEVEQELRSIHEEYSVLEREFDTVSDEEWFNLKNPLNRFQSDITYDRELHTPLIELRLFSGNSKVVETQDRPHSFLDLSQTSIEIVNRGLEQTEQEKTGISNEEIGRVKEQRDVLDSKLSELDEHIEQLEEGDSDDS